LKIIQDEGGFSQEELVTYKPAIYSNCISQMRAILEATVFLQLELSSENSIVHAKNILSLPSGLLMWNRDIANSIKILWQDPRIREIYTLGTKKYQLNETAGFFFDNIDRFMNDDFVPMLDDVLRVRIKSTGIEEAFFYFGGFTYKVVDVGGQRSERRKWIHCFDKVTAIIFCASLNEYDQLLREDNTQNRMMESLLLFDEVANSNWFPNNDIILFLNKEDLFMEKIKIVDLNVCFKHYTGGMNAENAKSFIKARYLERTNQHVYVHFTTAINTENIAFVINSVRMSVLEKAMQETGIKL